MEEKIKLTVILKTKNNEEKLCETLESIKDFDEIIHGIVELGIQPYCKKINRFPMTIKI